MRFFLFTLAILFMAPAFAQETNYLPNQVLVRFEPNTDVDVFWQRLDMSTKRPMPLKAKRLIAPYMNIWKITYGGDISAREVSNLLLRKQEVAVAQVNHRVYSRTTPNDPLFGTQWQWQNIAAEQAWDVTTGGITANGDTIVVAIIDDGTQLDHPDLQANIWHNYAEIPDNGIDDDGNGYVDDFNGWNTISGNNDVNNGGHGISVAGMIGATGNDGNQGVGANWHVKLMTIVGGTAQEAEVIESYSYALAFRKKYNETNGAEGAFVVATNSSWGIDQGQPDDAPLWCAFYDSLGVNGILSCGATANAAWDVDIEGDLPTACPSEYMVAVTATDNNDSRNFSAWGLNTIDVGAPGDNIYTTESGGGYGFTSGTSFASPLTAGVIALLYSAPCPDIASLSLTSPDVAALLVRDYLFNGVDQTDQLVAEIKTGGRINAHKSMQLLMGGCGACTPPFSIQANDITDVSASLSFTALNDSAHIYIRPAGTTEWDTILFASTPYPFTGLVACTEYEVAMHTVCADSLSDLSPIYTFKTDGCCELPANFHIANITNNTTTFAWDYVLAATSFDVTYAPDPFTTGSTVSTSDTTITIDNLTDCTAYQAKIRTNCANSVVIDYGTPLDFKTSGCGACTDLSYCESSGDDNTAEYIDSLEIVGIFVNASGPETDGYGFYDNMNINLLPVQPYEMIITPGYSGFTFSEHVKVWIDFNQNGLFEGDEVIVNPDFSISEATSFNFSVPVTATAGLTRMRVRLDFGAITDSCGTFTYGEVEDYCINILGNDACIAPFQVGVTDVLDISATLHFTTLNDASANVYYRPVGTTVWDTVLDVSSPYMMTDLAACSNYEVVLETNCADSLSTLSPSFIFKTDGCCMLPDSFSVSNIMDNGALLTWEGVLAANSFDVIYAQEPFTSWDTITTSSLSTPLIGLTKCTKYQAKIRTNCSGNTLSFSSPIDFKTTGCGACLDLNYCESNGGTTDEWIDSVSVESVFDNPTGASTGYEFYSDLGINFTQDNTYNMTITPGYSGTIFGEYLKAWIDFNQNGTFDDDEVIFDTPDKVSVATTQPFTVPVDATPGLTRMRVILNYSFIENTCGEFTYGEVEDYCVTIKEAGYCLGPDSLYVDDIQYYSANMNWAVVDSSISYIVKHRKLGGTWEAATTTGNNYQLTNLDECTEYEAQVRAVCENGLGQKTFNLFKTQCLTGIHTPFGKNAFTVQPNPFSDEFEVVIHGFAAKDIQVRLFDILGKEIEIKAINNQGKMVITPNSQMAAGIYMLQLRTTDNTGTIRVIKE